MPPITRTGDVTPTERERDLFEADAFERCDALHCGADPFIGRLYM